MKIILLAIVSFIVSFIVFFALLSFGTKFYYETRYPDPTCSCKNEILKSNKFQSNIYKKELSRLLENSKDLETDYWYEKALDSNYISIIVQNDSICAKAFTTLKEDTFTDKNLLKVQLKKIRSQKEQYLVPLKGVIFQTSQDDKNTELYLKSIKDVIIKD